jgi:ketosteroid isomerase-like protein
MSAVEVINAHYEAIVNKQLEAILNKYVESESTYVVLEGPRLTTIGFTKIATGWKAFCESGLALESINWVEGPFVEEHSTMAWVAGIIVLKVAVTKNNENSFFENTFRATFVLLKTENVWKIKHEHVSVVHPDPYGIGDWLKNN